jgi:hypothetical protein
MVTPKQLIKRAGSHKTAINTVTPEWGHSAMTPLKFDDDKIDVRHDVPTRMHPDSLLNHIDTLNKDDTIGIFALSAAREALRICHVAYGRINDAEAVLRKYTKGCRPSGKPSDGDNVHLVNSTPTVQVEQETFVDAAEKALTRIAPQVDRRVRELSGIQETLSKRVSNAIDEPTRMTPEGLALAQEVRSHVRSLSGKARNAFVARAIEANDKATVAAVLHAQPFLSGLDNTALGMLRERAAAKFAPVDSAQLAATTAAIQQVSNAVTLLLERYKMFLSSCNASPRQDGPRVAEYEKKIGCRRMGCAP